MRKKEVIKTLKEFKETNDIELSDIDFNGDDDAIKIRSDLNKLSEYFVSYFDCLRNDFSECKDKEILDMIKSNEVHLMQIIDLSSFKYDDCEFAKSSSMESLRNYVKNNYFAIVDFFDVCLAVYNE
jgi:hypothetical protein